MGSRWREVVCQRDGSLSMRFRYHCLTSYIQDNAFEVNRTRCQCSLIHFPSGGVEKGDSIIIVYGIKDCFSNMLEVDKRAIDLHLFSSLPKEH